MSDLALTFVRVNGEQIPVEGLSTEDSYASLTARIAKETGIPEAEQRFLIGETFVPIDDGSAQLGTIGFTAGMTVSLIRVQGLEGKFRGQRLEGNHNDQFNHDKSTEDIHVQIESDGLVFIFVKVTTAMSSMTWKYKGPIENRKEGTFEIRVIRCENKMGQSEFQILPDKERDGVTLTQGWIDRLTGTLSADGEEVTIAASGVYSATPPSVGPFRKLLEAKRWDGKDAEVTKKNDAGCCIIS